MKPEEIIEAHASTFVHMWTLTVMYNAITPLTSNRLPARMPAARLRVAVVLRLDVR